MQQLRQAVAYLALALGGCATLFFVAGTRYVVSRVEGLGSEAIIVLGGMGKIYLMYLVVVMVAVLMNLESMLRSAPASAQRRLRALFVAFVIGILSELLMVSAGLLYGSVRVEWMVLSAAPMFVAGVITALALARQRLSDMAVPVARPVIYYSSVSLTLAGAFLLSMAVLSKVLPVLSPEWKRSVSFAFYVLVGGGGLALIFSPRANRVVKRFVDRNFYANRYDYRREWERVSRGIAPTGRLEDIARQIEVLLRNVFDTERIAIHLRDDLVGGFHLVHPPPGTPIHAVAPSLRVDNPIVVELDRVRAPLVFRELAQDLELIPVVAENRPLVQTLSAAVCAPLHTGDQMVGLLWLSEKRTDDEYSFEDAEFLGAMSRQLAAALWFARVGEQLAETRQLESLHRLSTFVLHDIKNQVSGLSLVVENAQRHLTDPEFQRDAMQVVERTVHNLRQLMGHVAGVAKPTSPGNNAGIRVSVRCREDLRAVVDHGLIVRVLTNLLTNAREAVQGTGEIEIGATSEPGDRNGRRRLTLSVKDSGEGMSEEFLRHSLFRPFATTKASGLGIGLMQSKAIVEAHGGTIRVESRPGRGTRFEVSLPERPNGESTAEGH
ncbi:MAG: PEP-CTERM system histidine kinase PrsK [Candidatus Eisenbacteria bacterium]|uniref:histidine kinase n=1 Tax=Eiseniibacteriota bacterium TaxID=2212470 RepID=A0A538U3Z6_UNCEI|nr:MAG: PEP-CTERM system histidine kinase PrsK [Candidatus Eisenbacteria bacterium]